MSELLNFILNHEDTFKNRARLASLWSDFPLHKVANPDGYAANSNAWKKALFHASRAGVIPSTIDKTMKKGEKQSGRNDVLVMATGQELARALENRPWGIPSGLASVIHDAVASRELVPLSDFQTSKYSIYSRSWIPTPWQVIQWSLKQLGLAGGTPNRLSVGRFVVVENVEAAANAVLLLQAELHRSTSSGIYSLQNFTHHFSHALGSTSPSLTATDILILLTYMSRDKPSLTYSPNSQTIKFTSPTSTTPEEISETDISIAQVKSLHLSLELAIPPLEKRLSSLETAAREAVSKQQISSARSLLKSKKLVESTLEKRRANLLQVEESLAAIDAAADNVAIIHGMQKSAAVLKTLNESIGGVEGVERITDALKEEMATAEDIGRIVAEPGAEAVSEGDVEEEFEELVEEERKKVQAKEDAEKKIVEEKERAAREKREAAEKVEREKKEKEEAEVTRRRLAELAEFEKKRAEEKAHAEALSASTIPSAPTSEMNGAQEASPQATAIPANPTKDEPSLENSVELMGRMSLDETIPSTSTITREKEEEDERREAVPAT